MGDIQKAIYNNAKRKAEGDLRNYPYWLLSIESGLGEPVRYDRPPSKTNIKSDPTLSIVEEEDYKHNKVTAINFVLDRLDPVSRRIIDLHYFRDTHTWKEILEELEIDKNKFYMLKKKSLYKVIVALGYI